ncbi:exodeoxyribonuclease VII large subunit [compost metagenome]
MTAAVKEKRLDLQGKIRHLDALSPLKVMSRGYSLVYDEQEKKLIKTIADVEVGDIVRVKMADGLLDCHVQSLRGERSDGSENK